MEEKRAIDMEGDMERKQDTLLTSRLLLRIGDKNRKHPHVGGLQRSCQEKSRFQRRKWREHSQKRLQIKGILIMTALVFLGTMRKSSRDGEAREKGQRRHLR